MSRPIRNAVIIGAGVVGVATAYALAKRGIAVTLIEARNQAGQGTSYANGGQLSYLYTNPLASHHILRELPGLALGLNPAFRIRTNPDPDFIVWLLSFLRNCTEGRYLRNSRNALEIALDSRLEMLKLLQLHELDFDYLVRGKLQLLYSEKAVKVVKEGLGHKHQEDDDQHLMTLSEATKLEPALRHGADKPVMALYTPSEAVGDATKFANALLETLKTEYGATVRFNERVTDAELASSEATLTLSSGENLRTDLLVLCTGVDRKLLKKLKLSLPIYPMKGYSITAPKGIAPPQMSLTDTKHRLVFTPLGDRMRIAGMADLGWKDEHVDPKRLDVLMAAAKASFPAAADYDNSYNHWAGLRPMTPDSVPRLGHPHPALAYNLGHGMLGWTMAMGTGERIGKMVSPELLE